MVEPLRFSLGCLDGCDQNAESPFSVHSYLTNSLNRQRIRKTVEKETIRKSWGSSDNEKKNNEFWASIKEPYDFIMGTPLIPDIFEVASKDHISSACTEMELSWDPEDVSPHYVWSYSEFLDQYNELYEWLIQVQLQLYSHSNPPDKNSRLDQQEELRRRIYRRKLFVEQGEKVALKYPASEEEIKWRVNYLNNKWEQLQNTLTPVVGRSEEIAVELDLVHEEKLLRSWLSTMEGEIQPITCRLPRGCSLHALQERYKDNQILLKDIKAHGPILKSVVKQYERQVLSQLSDSNSPTTDLATKHSYEVESLSFPLATEATDAKDKEDRSIRVIPRRAKSLEKRYHQVYLRSLEWHYYLEGAIVDFKDQRLSCSSSDSDDEPVSKCPRLSKVSYSSGLTQSDRRKPCPLGWSDYEVNSSEAGSYIEDDYVMTSSEAVASRKNIFEKDDSVIEGNVHSKDLHLPVQSVMNAATSGDAVSNVKMTSCNNNNETYPLLFNNKNEKFNEIQNNRVTSSKRLNCKKSQGSPVTTRLTSVDRPSPNCGVFDCKHSDTDSDIVNDDDDVGTRNKTTYSTNENLNVQVIKKYGHSFIKSSNTKDAFEDEEVDQEDLQRIIDSAILDQDWLNSNITISDSDGSVYDENEDHEIPVEDVISNPEQSDTTFSKECIHRLVSDAENLVREPMKFPGQISTRPHLKPLPLGEMSEGKQIQIKQWLNAQNTGNHSSLIMDGSNIANIQDSCDASGELTTGESDIFSNDSDKEGFDTSLATEKESSLHLLSSENTPTMEGSPLISLDDKKVKVRGKKRQRTFQRPWSVTDENQLSGGDQSKVSTNVFIKITTKNKLSSSEPSLDCFEGSQKAIPKQILSHSDPKIWNPSETRSHNIMHTLPVIISKNVNTSANTSDRTKEKDASILMPTGCLRRRTKLRRRSNRQLLGIRTDSGSDDFWSVSSRKKAVKYCTYSPYHSPSKSLSSESESVSGCPKPVKVLSFSSSSHLTGECAGQSKTVMTSSTEKCLSDSSAVSSVLHHSGAPKFPNKNADLIKVNQKRGLAPSQQSHVSDQEGFVHQEDASSLSEQAWDNYQEYKYLSEPYSEDVDLDAERKLIEFGDDYRNFIDSDGSSFYGYPYRSRRSPKNRRMRGEVHPTSDSESDLEDLHQVIAESRSQLSVMEKMLESFVGQVAIGLDLEDVISTANTNLKFLQDILKHLNRETPKLNSDFSDLQSIVDGWGNVQSKALERQQQSAQFRQLQRQLKSHRLNIESVLSRCSGLTVSNALDNFSQVSNKLEEMKGLLNEAETMRSDLSGLNVIVHRFISEMGPSFTSLKDEMAELYRLWDETHRRVNGELSNLQNISAACRLWEEQKSDLSKALKQDSETLKVIDAAIDSGKLTETVSASVRDVAKLLNEKRKLPCTNKTKYQVLSGEKSLSELSVIGNTKREDRLSDSGTSGYESCSSDDLSERERRLAYLRRLARDLQSSLLPGSIAWNEVNATLDEAEKELKGLQDHCRMLILKTTETLEPNSKPLRFSSNCKRKNWVREKGCRSARVERRSRVVGGNRRGGDWVLRVARAAVPFQVALMLLLCVAYLLEPNCCDSVNTFNLSFTPQLRYVHGSPPV